MTTQPQTLPTSALITFGLYTGAAGIVINAVLYAIDSKVYLSSTWLSGLVALFIGFYFAFKVRKENIPFPTYGQAFTMLFIIFACSGIVALLFEVVLYTLIDPSLTDILREQSMEAMEKASQFIGEDATEKALEELENQDLGMTPYNVMIKFVTGIAASAIVAAIGGAFLKKEQKAF